ncbi:MAG: glycerophosphodiester phosphodiesterase [Deltaproteobacteria bacterium]|nr:glycerophosphodiester phosphodiesterase [Deltaproteobacteria bacterium]
MKNVLLIVLIVMAVFIVLRWIATPFTKIQTRKRVLSQRQPVEIIAHRGGSLEWPENTLLAFENSAPFVDAIETDLHLTKDGEIVLIHDPTVNRTTDGKGAVADMTLLEIEKLNAGYYFTKDNGQTYPYRAMKVSIPTLKDALARLPKMKWILEIKNQDDHLEEKLVSILQENNLMENVIVSSEYHIVLERIHQRAPSIATGSSRKEIKRLVYLHYFKLLPFYKPMIDSLQVPPEHEGTVIITKTWVRAMHNKNLPIQAWTINEENDMKRLIEMKIDGIITDRPSLLKTILK